MANNTLRNVGILSAFVLVAVGIYLAMGSPPLLAVPAGPPAPPTDGDGDTASLCTATSVQVVFNPKHSVNLGTPADDINVWLFRGDTFVAEQRISSDRSFDVAPSTLVNPATLNYVLFDDDSSMTYYGREVTGVNFGCVNKPIAPLLDEIGGIGVVIYNSDGNGNSVSNPKPLSPGDVETVIIRLQETAVDKVFGGGGIGIVLCVDYNSLQVDELTLANATKTGTPSGHIVADLDLSTVQCFSLADEQLIDKQKEEYILTIDVDDSANIPTHSDGAMSTGFIVTVYDPCLFQNDVGDWVNGVRDPDTSATICASDGNALIVQ